ncbi:DUF2963 domain-containing protein [Candidatus Phytoplasma pruni]|uniref:DUF2963 domain-containing protein n=1 Tax=Candidatus Phytoplasma pruni TaxID=479893 RepID=A0A851HD25_9MOLU|nr:hypothetical protein [Candidatus Phytoplasma pruni]NWN45981.1 hypothetical protein [Candidatus Phytoplasma pruni]
MTLKIQIDERGYTRIFVYNAQKRLFKSFYYHSDDSLWYEIEYDLYSGNKRAQKHFRHDGTVSFITYFNLKTNYPFKSIFYQPDKTIQDVIHY